MAIGTQVRPMVFHLFLVYGVRQFPRQHRRVRLDRTTGGSFGG